MDWATHHIPGELAGSGSLYVETHGDGQSMPCTLVLCDGLMCEGHVWKYLTSHFKGRCRLLHWHYPGHGKSSKPAKTAPLGPADIAKQLLHILDALKKYLRLP